MATTDGGLQAVVPGDRICLGADIPLSAGPGTLQLDGSSGI
jgi:hypothetical protein